MEFVDIKYGLGYAIINKGGDFLLRIALGNDIFLNYINESDVYVDKTLFIKEIIDSTIQISLITRLVDLVKLLT